MSLLVSDLKDLYLVVFYLYFPFNLTGYSNGDVERFNIQSGIHRASYGKPAHKAAIRGIACDNLNQFVITGCSAGLLKFWHFKESRKCILFF